MNPEDWAALEEYLDSQMPIIKALYGTDAELFFTESAVASWTQTPMRSRANALCVTLHGWIRVPEAIVLGEPRLHISA